ncbi:MAG TPA: universal stress protein [Bacteroidia bacterium]|jgi:nucleotide-binding universal stress UspA family protein|nr:universal stress protein [Bacteroidia bacterium]
MDLSKLKGRPSFPFETIGVAIAFSPRLEDLLGEANRLANAFHAQLIVFHIGERNRNKEAKLDEAFQKLGIDEKKTRVIWNNGNPVNTLLELCKLNIVDLLVIGALQKENVLQYYLGSVARRVSRRAKCSVLLLTNPVKSGSKFRKMMVNGIDNPKTESTIRTAAYFAEHIATKDIIVVKEVDQPAFAMSMTDQNTAGEAMRIRKEINEEEMNKVDAIIARCSKQNGFEIQKKLVKGKPGFAIRQYAETKKADLLVINSPDQKYGLLDRIFTHDMEYILENIPCNILIVHSRIS